MKDTAPWIALRISDCEFLAGGTIKSVYGSSKWPNAVVKIVHPHLVGDNGHFTHQRGLKKLYSLGVYRGFAREILQYLKLCRAETGTNTATFPIATPYGFVATDKGLAMISERIVDENGDLAPSLSQLVKSKMFNGQHAEALDAFFDDCARLQIVFGEVNSAGILFASRRSGKAEFVLVDGIGEKNFIPLKSWFKILNTRRVRDVQKRTWARIKEEQNFSL